MIIFSLIMRILSNPFANVFQKKLTSNYGAFFVNSITYFGLVLFVIPLIVRINWLELDSSIWFYGVLGGILGALGNAALVKALSLGDLSVLGPINAYKSVVAMILGIFLLKEFPSVIGLLGIVFIILGSYFIFDTVEEKFTLKLLARKDIQYRLSALFLTGLEALMIKKVIILSSVSISFVLWCLFGFVFSLLFSFMRKEQCCNIDSKSLLLFFGLILMFGIMQITTNYVFNNMNVSYALALFQLSAIVNVVFGYKFFREKHLIKKLIGTTIMIFGAGIIILS